MAVKITGGQHRGRLSHEPIPKSARPTSARVREALFSIVGQQLEGTRFLDAFAGAGIMSLEAWSRGADVVAVEIDRTTFRSLVRRGREVDAKWTLKQGDVLGWASKLGLFDVVFADPPYALDILPIAEALAPISSDWLVLEVETGTTAPDRIDEHVLDRVREYGRTDLWFYRRSSE